ncbi:MAG: ATP-grasp domain-containing protein [Thermoanaerobaculia bacterium]|nr:Acetyl-/propionyl-coenzyme A carboxylase alpha chain [Thermoanaerobaculia bacterium]MCK6683509.1 ATP-grasp domain-containing protein [Thermoanaerobaculia bacterium]
MPPKVLIANRGEIALRVMRACRVRGLETVAVYSEADALARHVEFAGEAYEIGPPPARDSYLCAEKILEVARASHASAIHPGFGFLSENASFARAVLDAGLIWIGPPPSAIEAMGLKIESRRRMIAAGVPVVPGTHSLEDASERLRVGLPCVVKASAGGGGKGMRVVRSHDALDAAIASCRREAQAAFGDPTLYLERYIERPRHVEIQVFGDSFGRVVSLGERDCSIQRRHQKVIEESPSPAVTPQLRQKLGEAAVAAAKAVGYINAGTVEFLLAPDGEFYFLEMNTRLQVEHPVTEEAFGVDLVDLQLAVAFGDPLPLDLPDAPRSHAIEARVYAEDSEAGYLPQTGKVLRYIEPAGPGIRMDSGIREGSDVSVHYDPMLAKLIARGRSREEARRRLVAALDETVILGVKTNLSFLRRVLETPEFIACETDTAFLERVSVPPIPPPDEHLFRSAAACFGALPAADGTPASAVRRFDPMSAGAFRILAP